MKSFQEIQMSVKAFAVGVAILVWATPGAAQMRGTMEFGAFGSAASFDNSLSLKTGYGAGARVGMFLAPRWSIEFEDAEMRASRPNGLKNVNVGILSGRLVAVPVKTGSVSFLLGAGAGVSTETNFLHSYGVDALVGAKLALNDNIALRVDGVWDWLANQKWKTYKSVRVGLSVYRHPARELRTTTATTAAPATITHEDSVSAAETHRLRDRDAALAVLRDSLNGAPARSPLATSAAALATMQAEIHFAFDKSEITDSAKTLLDEKVAVFRDNPAMTIVLLGYTDLTGTDAYNMSLGARRAQAAKDYIVAHGISANRVVMESKGERQQLPNLSGVDGEAANRRAIFRLLIAPDVIKK
jgi:outer membrane protein OmpA-like peptidoglycan-associated protein